MATLSIDLSSDSAWLMAFSKKKTFCDTLRKNSSSLKFMKGTPRYVFDGIITYTAATFNVPSYLHSKILYTFLTFVNHPNNITFQNNSTQKRYFFVRKLIFKSLLNVSISSIPRSK